MTKYTINNKIIHRTGFTIIELMVVIAILGILVSLTAFGWKNWQQGITEKEAKSDIISLANAMESSKNFGSGYTTALPATYKAGSNVTPEWKWGDGTQYCVQMTSKKIATIVYYIRNGQGSNPQQGACPASPLVPTAPAVPTITTTQVDASTTGIVWATVPGALSYQVQWRQNGGAWTNISRTNTNFYRSGAVPATNEYQVRSVGAGGLMSAWSNTQSLSTFNGPTYATLCQEGGQSYVSWGSAQNSTYPKYHIELEGSADQVSEDITNTNTNPVPTTYYHPQSYSIDSAEFGSVYYVNALGHRSEGRTFANATGQGGSCQE